jgi:uncharacterized protein
MTNESYRAAIETYIATHANPTHKFGHQPRLYALTQQIGEGLTYDDDVVFAAVWLHDLGVFIGHRPDAEETLKTWDHVAYVTEKAPSILKEAAFPEEKIPAVLEVIRTHQPQDTPITTVGAIGITRTLAKLGSDTRFCTFTEALHALQKQLTTLPLQLRIETSKTLAIPRIAAMQSFVEALESEAGPNLY